MSRTPDSFPGERQEESILFESGSLFPLLPGEMLYATGTISGSGFVFNEEGAVFGPASSFLTSGSHPRLRQLIHLAENGPYEGFVGGSTLDIGPQPYPTASIWKEANGAKLVEKLWTRSANKSPTIITWKVYAANGVTVLTTVTDTITYQGAFETSRTRTIA